ncbi:Glycerol-3-phosphate responsive antiterminator [Acididesulfobacillus acetoxydans]|uniref:Glycerol-3-phosphate responsive antiterminator n=1 Tax=Acididesulfobacillus acetoxydans TaxID=1561005 RepID=A0A8S0XVW6_9FIRM|nr:glycerol-3-phosphate responsive antiterminator [Acididesulfobacillus acetoxydans]CAA7600647.1 Glycerol-3-phosphate responsive antiterminator [Acididesulfobacillus acetoxydans]CEJ09428.1 Glycerol-3-phosphate responsive antiterminator (MRNA-binding) [Acididesulfobacillus acetoxydans]
MHRTFKGVLADSRIVPAVKHLQDLAEVLKIPWVSVIFLLGGEIGGLDEALRMSRKHPEKFIFVHLDLLEGIGKDAAGIRFLKHLGLQGVVSVKWQLLKYAKEQHMLTVQRLFLVDSEAIHTGLRVISKVTPDALEVLPATVPKFAIEQFRQATDLSILGGGLLRDEADVRLALLNGLTAVTASRRDIWNLHLT